MHTKKLKWIKYVVKNIELSWIAKRGKKRGKGECHTISVAGSSSLVDLAAALLVGSAVVPIVFRLMLVEVGVVVLRALYLQNKTRTRRRKSARLRPPSPWGR